MIRVLLVIVGVIFIVALILISLWLIAAARVRVIGRKMKPAPSDAGIVLGAYTDGFKPSPTLTARLRAGLHLYRLGYISYFIVSGGRGTDETVHESSSMKRFLVLNQVPPELILEDRHSSDTWENLKNSQAVMQRHNLQTAVVVTSDYHLPRALAVAHLLGMRVSGFSAPSSRSEFKYAMREVVARVKYMLNGQAGWRKKGR